jgi:diadenosine tetraphosphate (Ap4A) HIT family hydrolase
MKLFPDLTILVTENFTVGQDWEVPIDGFYILSPTRKISSIDQFTDAEAREYGLTIRRVREAMRTVLGIKDVYFFQNEDTSHGYHLWLFPRHGWMESFGRKIESVRSIMNYAERNMATPQQIEKVHQSAERMKAYLTTLA